MGLQGIVVPVFARVQHDREALLRGLLRAYRLIAFIAFPAFGGLALIAPELVPLLLGAKWIEAVPVVQASAVPTLLYAMGILSQQRLDRDRTAGPAASSPRSRRSPPRPSS